MDQIVIDELAYHINTLEMCRLYFGGLVHVLKIEDAIEPFLLSVSRAPIDSCLDIIRLYLREFQRNQLRELRNPRQLYAPMLHKQYRGVKPHLEYVADSISFLFAEVPAFTPEFDEFQHQRAALPMVEKPAADIARELEVPLVFLEKLIRNYFNPWEIVAYEYLTGRLRAELTEIDPYACFLDVRAAKNYRLYSEIENLLSAKDLALPKFFTARAALAQPCFKRALLLLRRLRDVPSPSQTALVITVIYRLVEQSIKEQLLVYKQSRQAASQSAETGRFQLAGASRNAELLTFEADDNSMETSARQTQAAMESETHSDGATTLSGDSAIVQAVEPASPEPVVFGADEITPVMILAIILAKPHALNRTIAAAELFSLPFIIKLPAVEYAVLMLKSAGIAFSNGFEEFKRVTKQRKASKPLHGPVTVEAE